MFLKVIKVDAECRVQTWKNHLIHDPFPQRLSFVKSLCYLQIFFINFFIHDFHLDIERKEVNHQLCQSKTTAVNLVKIFVVQDKIMQVPSPGNKSKFFIKFNIRFLIEFLFYQPAAVSPLSDLTIYSGLFQVSGLSLLNKITIWSGHWYTQSHFHTFEYTGKISSNIKL